MKKFTFTILTAALFLSANLVAGEQREENRIDESERMTVTWVNPKEFTDVKPSMGVASKFRERTMTLLTEYMNELASELPEDQTLNIKVTDVDLAGRVWPGAREVRVVRQLEIPRMDFSYELLNADGSVVKSDTVELKDMGFMDSVGRTFRNDPLKYEKNMLQDWFNKEFKQELLVSN